MNMTNERLTDPDDFSIGRVISLSFRVLGRNLVSFVLLAILVRAAVIAINFLIFANTTSPFIASLTDLVDTLGTSLLTAMVAYGTYRELRGTHAGLGEVVGRGLSLIVPIFFVGLLVAIIVGLGFVLLIVPGILFATILWVAIPVAVVERPGIFAALSRSRDLTKGSRWEIVGLVILIYLPMLALLFALGAMSGTLEGETLVIAGVVEGLFSLFASVAAAVGYFELRTSKEGIDVSEIAAVFD